MVSKRWGDGNDLAAEFLVWVQRNRVIAACAGGRADQGAGRCRRRGNPVYSELFRCDYSVAVYFNRQVSPLCDVNLGPGAH
jgi:hypothetical protein